MVDINKLKSALDGYKQYFPSHWQDEKYKWIAVEQFKKNWNIDAPDFEEMFKRSTSKAENLLISRNVYPAGMILEFTRADEEATREMFRMLFDETLDLAERIADFRNRAEELRQKYGNGEWKNHYQSINYISTYLWLMYPDKYYIYKYELYKKCAALLDNTYQPKANGAPKNVIGGYRMYDEIRAVLQEDSEFRQMLNEALTEDCYSDPELITATIDFGFYIARFYQEDTTQNDDWFPSLEEYTPGITVEDWTDLLHNPDVFDQNSLDVIRAFYDIGGQATCSELAQKYGNTAMHYSGIVTGLAKRIQKATSCPLVDEEKNENAKWWPILFVGKYADSKQQGVYIWKLRDELKMTLAKTTGTVVNTWLLTWNPTKWDWDDYDEVVSLSRIGKGYLTGWNCANRHAQVGDRVFMVKLGDPSTPRGIFASGYITSDFWEGEHFDDSKDNTIMYVDVVLTKVLDYRSDNIITIDELKQRFPEQSWSPQASGISIKVDAARWLIEQWDRPNASPSINDNSSSLEIDLDSDADSPVYTYDMIQQFHSNARFVRWLKPIVDALRELGGSASRTTVHNRIIEMCNVTRNELAQTNTSGNSQLLNDIDWARNYLAYEGIIDKSAPHGTWSLSALGKNIDLTQELAEKIIVKWVKIKAAEREGNPVPIIDLSPFYVFKIKSYSENDFLSKVYMSKEQYRELSALLLNKQNVILQGAPGVGKTYAARRLAWSIMGEQDDSRIAFVQFHQSYSYEDFIMGYRPNGNGGFDLQKGIFYQFCETARNNPGKKHFFIIDEINRGNLSKIFGELLMLIETDYRKESAALAYSKEQFSVPENLYIIGMMNTADRSLAMIDYALRRRFSFFEMQPAFDSDGFKAYSKGLNSNLFEALIDKIKQLNNKIKDDDALGEGFMIGHSYFCNLDAESCTADRLRIIVEYEIIPILKEYWFDDKDTAAKQADDLRGVFHDE